MKMFRLLSVMVFSLPLTVAHAQQVTTTYTPNTTVTPVSTPTGGTQVARARQENLRQLTTKLSQETGVRIVTDTALGRQQVTAPEGSVTKDTVEDYLTRVARRVSNDVLVLKIYLPSAENGKYSPDAIAQVARAQMELMGRPAPNAVQIQGKVLSTAEAEPVIRTLGLEPVYVLTTRQPQQFNRLLTNGAGGGTVDATNLMDGLVKQLGVAKASDIPSGTYKVNLPGPDGVTREATVEVENSEGIRKIRVMLGTNAPIPQ